LIANKELARIWKETALTCSETLSLNLPEGLRKKHHKPDRIARLHVRI
jgi:hypothetical protein